MLDDNWKSVKDIVVETNEKLKQNMNVSSKSIGQICKTLFSNGTLEKEYKRNAGFLEMFWRRKPPSNTNEPQVGNKSGGNATGEQNGINNRNATSDRQTDSGSGQQPNGSNESNNADARWQPALVVLDGNRIIQPKLYRSQRTTQHGDRRIYFVCGRDSNGK
jgi:hypothetical protein